MRRMTVLITMLACVYADVPVVLYIVASLKASLPFAGNAVYGIMRGDSY